MRGYIILSEDERVLMRCLAWTKKSIAEAYVHSREAIERIRGICKDWNIKPYYTYPASFDGKTVTITGERRRF